MKVVFFWINTTWNFLFSRAKCFHLNLSESLGCGVEILDFPHFSWRTKCICIFFKQRAKCENSNFQLNSAFRMKTVKILIWNYYDTEKAWLLVSTDEHNLNFFTKWTLESNVLTWISEGISSFFQLSECNFVHKKKCIIFFYFHSAEMFLLKYSCTQTCWEMGYLLRAAHSPLELHHHRMFEGRGL